MTKIYFDVCCYNRPFDDLSQGKIRLETEAILGIVNQCIQKECKVFTSSAIDFELDKMSESYKKQQVLIFYNSIDKQNISYDEKINIRAKELSKYNIRYLDGLHVAFCESSEIEYLVTTDKVLINAAKKAELGTKVVNPVEFIMEES